MFSVIFKKFVDIKHYMDSSVRLGGNIELFGIENFDNAQMIVLKKIIGMYARKFSEKGLERLAISFSDGIAVEAICNGTTHASSAEHENVFFGVDLALKDIESKL